MASAPLRTKRTASPEKGSFIQVRILVIVGVLTASALGMLAASPVPTSKPGNYPAWWFSRGVIAESTTNSTPAWPTDYPTSDDYTVINEGQLKNLATKAYAELLAQSPTNALTTSQATNLAILLQGWSTNAINENDYTAVNLGELKTVAKPFHDLLIQFGYETSYPWTGSGADDYSAANSGQAKNAFSFDVGLDADADGLPDWWEWKYFGYTGLGASTVSSNGTGLTLLQCYEQEVDPLASSSGSIASSGLALWLRADVGVTHDGSGNVSGWVDQSTSHNDLNGGAATLTASAINGMPGVSFDGGAQYLDRYGFTGLSTGSADRTMIVVARYDGYGWGGGLSYGAALTNEDSLLGVAADGAYYVGTFGAGPEYGSSIVGTGYLMQTMELTSGTITAFQNGTSVGTSSGVTWSTPANSEILLGASINRTPYIKQTVCEVLCYNRALTSTEQQAVEVYLADKYGLYHPDATWPLAYSSGVQAEITRNQWSKAQADAYVALQSDTSGVALAGLALWLKADAGITKDGSGNVSAWTDQALNYSLTQSGGARPLFVPSDINGKPALRFSGGQSLYNSADIGLNSDMTMIVVGESSSPGSLQASLWLGSSPTASVNRGMGYTSSEQYFYGFGNDAAGGSAPDAGVFSTQIVTLDSAKTGVNFYLNGVANGSGSLSALLDIVPGISVGAIPGWAYYWQGDIAEVLVYDHKLTSTELTQTDGYLADKYGIYDPNATWPLAYSSGVQAEITRNQWSKDQADAYVALQSDTSGVVTNGLTLWLKADAGVTQDGSGNVSGWADQALNKVLTQTGSARPLFVSSDLNGKPALRFSGGQSLYNSANIGLNSDMTMIVVGESSSPGSLQASLWLGSTSSYTNRGMGYTSSEQYFYGFADDAAGGNAPDAGLFSTQVVTLDSTKTGVNFYLNGVASGSGSLSGLLDIVPGISVGAIPGWGYDWQGDIAEVLVYDHQLTSTELQQVSVYLANKYDLPYYGYAAPAISPAGGSYIGSQAVTISGPASPAVIKYTLDGTQPTIYSATYTGSFTLTGSALVQTAVFVNGGVSSPVASDQFYVNDSGSTGLPTTPTSLSETVVSGHQINLSWTLSGQLNYSAINVYRSSDGGTTYQLIASLDPTATSYTDWSVSSGATYQYYVGTLNSTGESDTSASSSVTATASGTMTISVSAPSGATSLP